MKVYLVTEFYRDGTSYQHGIYRERATAIDFCMKLLQNLGYPIIASDYSSLGGGTVTVVKLGRDLEIPDSHLDRMFQICERPLL